MQAWSSLTFLAEQLLQFIKQADPFYSFNRLHHFLLNSFLRYSLVLLCPCFLMDQSHPSETRPSLRVASWNIAAINNNPFEYWISYPNEIYNKMMDDVQNFINNPGDKDVPVSEIFTEDMYQQLKALMISQAPWASSIVEQTDHSWNSDYKNRKSISQFLKDNELGSKRLASMPDRLTNTIYLSDGKQAFRPTPINAYPETFQSFQDWWSKWKQFMFDEKFQIDSMTTTDVVSLLQPIKKSKYPAITVEEEAVSLPLQTLCLAIFDAILVNMLNHVAPDIWQSLRFEISQALNLKKNDITLNLLYESYKDMDIIFLQEVALSFTEKIRSHALHEIYHFVIPKLASKRDQNSIILFNKSKFNINSVKEVSELVTKCFTSNVPVEEGDLLAITLQDTDGVDYLLASYHGDTNGLATIPVLNALDQVRKQDLSDSPHKFIFGLDANTYEIGRKGKTQDVTEFARSYVNLGLTSCWGDSPNPKNYTTFNARTFLQPQLNKSCCRADFTAKGDINPKDFIVFDPEDFTPKDIVKDNTGNKRYIENMVFPTLRFPSDHAVLSCTLENKLDQSFFGGMCPMV